MNKYNYLCRNLVVLFVYLFILIIQCAGTEKVSGSERLKILKTYADNVLEKGIDKWSGQNTPLLADGINILTGDPVTWLYYDKQNALEKRWIMHDLANQQNLFRLFMGLSNLTGDKKYQEAAENAFKYHFEHLKSSCGLLYWGGHQFIDLKTLLPVPHEPFTPHFGERAHEFKYHFPLYELMWNVDEEATKRFVEAFWNAHITDWSILDMNRHGKYHKPVGNLWKSRFDDPDPFFEVDGLTFLNAGSDLVYAATSLYLLDGNKEVLAWAKRLFNMYVKARHPETGLGAHQYTKLRRTETPPAEGAVPNKASYGDRAENQFGKDFPDAAIEAWTIFGPGLYTIPVLCYLELSERLGEEGNSFLNHTINGLKAYVKHGYIPEKNAFKPMWADGTDLSGYIFPRGGYFGKEGEQLSWQKANEFILFSFARAYRLSGDTCIWDTFCSIFKNLGFGNIKYSGESRSDLDLNTTNSSPYAIFALLEISRATGNQQYLKLAEIIGNNLMDAHYYDGYFLKNKTDLYVNFNIIEPLALISLEAALQDKTEAVPIYSGSRGFIHGIYGDAFRSMSNENYIWSKKRDE